MQVFTMYIRFFAFVIITISNVLILLPSAYAESYKASALQTTDLESDKNCQQGIHQHSPAVAIVVTEVSGRFGIYRFELVNNKIELLRTIQNIDLQISCSDEPHTKFHTVGNLTFIEIRGKLYSTDGSRENTQFIRDFGFGSPGGNLGLTLYSKIDGISELDDKLLIVHKVSSTFLFLEPEGFNLIISDGTREGTRKVGPTFHEISSIFNVNGEAFFFGRLKPDDNPQIWQISDSGKRLSKVLDSEFGSINSRITIGKDTAYFCLDGKIATFPDKSLEPLSALKCDEVSNIGEYKSSIVFTMQDTLFILNKDTMTTSILFKPDDQADSVYYRFCTNTSNLIFEVEDRVFSYSDEVGLRESYVGPDFFINGMSCVESGALISTRFGVWVYNVPSNSLKRISGINEVELFNTNFDGFSRSRQFDLITYQDKFFTLTHQTIKQESSPNNFSYFTRFTLLEIIKTPQENFNLTPIITELLFDDSTEPPQKP